MKIKSFDHYHRLCGIPEELLGENIEHDSETGRLLRIEGDKEIHMKVKRPDEDVWAENLYIRSGSPDFDSGDFTWEQICKDQASGPEGSNFWGKCASEGKLIGEVMCQRTHDPKIASILEGSPNFAYAQVSLAPKNNESLIFGDYQNSKRTSEIKIGRGLKKAYPFWEESTVEKYTNLIKAEYAPLDFRILKAAELIWAYDERNNRTDTGTLSNSCLRYEKCHNMLKIYQDNPDTVQLLVAMKGAKISGRALMWKTDAGIVMDRIYGSDQVIQAFKNYADEHKMYHKTHQNYDSKNQVTLGGKEMSKKFKIQLDWEGYHLMPYMDTFCYGGEGFITNNDSPQTFAGFRSPAGEIHNKGSWSRIEGRYVNNPYNITDHLMFDKDNRVKDDYGNWTHPSLLVQVGDKKVCKYQGYIVEGEFIPTSQISKLYG